MRPREYANAYSTQHLIQSYAIFSELRNANRFCSILLTGNHRRASSHMKIRYEFDDMRVTKATFADTHGRFSYDRRYELLVIA